MKRFPAAEVALGILVAAGLSMTAYHVRREWIRDRKPDTSWQGAMVASYVPTPQVVVDSMLELVEIGRGDVLYDLGSGDGRIVVTAARRYGIKAVGFEINPELIDYSREWIRKEGLEDLAEIRNQDLFSVDLAPASIVTLFLLKENNLRLRPVLQAQLKPGSRVASHMFDMGDWVPERTLKVEEYTLYLWRIGR